MPIAPGGRDPPLPSLGLAKPVDRDLRARWETMGGEAASNGVCTYPENVDGETGSPFRYGKAVFGLIGDAPRRRDPAGGLFRVEDTGGGEIQCVSFTLRFGFVMISIFFSTSTFTGATPELTMSILSAAAVLRSMMRPRT